LHLEFDSQLVLFVLLIILTVIFAFLRRYYLGFLSFSSFVVLVAALSH